MNDMDKKREAIEKRLKDNESTISTDNRFYKFFEAFNIATGESGMRTDKGIFFANYHTRDNINPIKLEPADTSANFDFSLNFGTRNVDIAISNKKKSDFPVSYLQIKDNDGINLMFSYSYLESTKNSLARKEFDIRRPTDDRLLQMIVDDNGDVTMFFSKYEGGQHPISVGTFESSKGSTNIEEIKLFMDSLSDEYPKLFSYIAKEAPLLGKDINYIRNGWFDSSTMDMYYNGEKNK